MDKNDFNRKFYYLRNCPISCLDRNSMLKHTMVGYVSFSYICCTVDPCRWTGMNNNIALLSALGKCL